MATFAINICKTDQRDDGDFPVSIRITQHRKSVYLTTSLYVCPEQLDKKFNLIDQETLLILLQKIKKCKEHIRDEYGEDIEEYSAKEIRDFLDKKFKGIKLDFVDFSRNYLIKMRKEGRGTTADPIEKTLNGFIDFMKRDKIYFDEIKRDILERFGEHLKEQRTVIRKDQFGKDRKHSLQPLDDYGVSRYYIDLRSLYYAGMKKYNDEDTETILIKRNPFKKLEISVKKGGDKTNIPIEDVRKIRDMPDHKHKRANFARDVFMLSFMLIGMNPVDLYGVDKIEDGRISYNRQKTTRRREDDAFISVKVEPEILALMEKYRDPTGERIFDFHIRYASSENFDSNLNKGLKDVQAACKIKEVLYMYIARRSWATIGRNKLRIPVDDITQSLNHVDEEHKTTWLYIDKDFTLIDEANRKMLDFLFVHK